MAKTKNSSLVSRLIHGRMISADFFVRHWMVTLVVVLFIMSYITTKYICQTNMEKIDALTAKLEVVENEKASQRSLFMGRTRETQMQQMVDSLGLGLKVQPQPPYKIK